MDVLWTSIFKIFHVDQSSSGDESATIKISPPALHEEGRPGPGHWGTWGVHSCTVPGWTWGQLMIHFRAPNLWTLRGSSRFVVHTGYQELVPRVAVPIQTTSLISLDVWISDDPPEEILSSQPLGIIASQSKMELDMGTKTFEAMWAISHLPVTCFSHWAPTRARHVTWKFCCRCLGSL